jgi:hypothetical protein
MGREGRTKGGEREMGREGGRGEEKERWGGKGGRGEEKERWGGKGGRGEGRRKRRRGSEGEAEDREEEGDKGEEEGRKGKEKAGGEVEGNLCLISDIPGMCIPVAVVVSMHSPEVAVAPTQHSAGLVVQLLVEQAVVVSPSLCSC